MQNINKEQLKANYEMLFFGKVQDLVIMRRNLLINQSRMAYYCGVSLKTIQNFENYKCKDSFIKYVYEQVLCKN